MTNSDTITDVERELLVDERDQLLRSIDDLERELAAGDIDATDYQTLLDSYTSRASEVLQRLNGEVSRPKSPTLRADHSAPNTPRWRSFAIAGGVAGIAIMAGIFVARSAGERVGDTGLTGSVRSAASQRANEIEALLTTARNNLADDPLTALKAYDGVHALDPSNVEAVAYGGWLVRNVARSTTDDAQHKELLAAAIARLDEAIGLDPTYPDALAFRAIVYLRDQNDPSSAAKLFGALDKLDPPVEIKQLTSAAAEEARASAKK